MPAIVVAPELPFLVVEQRGIFTVDARDATVRCNCPAKKPCLGIDVDKMALANRLLQRHCYAMGAKFVKGLASRGYEFVGGMRLHGPWPTYNFDEVMTDVESSIWADARREEDPSKVLHVVGERHALITGPDRMDYRLVGMFRKRAVLTEVIVPDATEEQ